MANDRFWLVCDRCGETLWLGKYYPSTGSAFRIDAPGLEIEKFMEAHFACHKLTDHDLDPHGLGFSFVNETQFCNRGGVIGGESTKIEPLKHDA